MTTTVNERRIRRAMARSYARARAALRDAREAGSDFAKAVAMELVREVRRINADRRRAIRLGRTVEATR